MDRIHDRESDNQSIGTKTTQTKLLCEFTQDHYLHQYIDGTTRKKNVLDLAFTNDYDMFTYQEKIDSVILTDHSLCILETTLEIETTELAKITNIVRNTVSDQYAACNGLMTKWEMNLNFRLES